MRQSKTILGSILVISLVSVIIAGSYTGAFFLDTETSEGNTFTAGTLNLQVGNADPVTWSLDENVMPGDSDGENISVENTGTIDGFLHINFTNLLNNDTTCTEPEKIAEEGDCGNDPNAGELAENLFITVYFDNDNSANFSIGDTLIYQGMVNNTTTSILQAKLVDSELLEAGTENFRIDWQIDGAVGNEVQSDLVQFDIPSELTQNPKTVLDGLVGYWTLNEKGNPAYDYSGNENNGVINEATLTNGKSGGALSFDGENDYMNIPDLGISSLDVTEVTIEAWINPNSYDVSGYTGIIVNKEDAWEIGLKNSTGELQGASAPGCWRWAGTYVVPLNTWTHVAVVWTGTNEYHYVNGTLVDTFTDCSTPLTTNDQDLRVGARGGDGSPNSYFKGIIDEVRVYNRALTADEIQQNFNAGN